MDTERQGDQLSALPWNDGGQDCLLFGLPQPETDDDTKCVPKSHKHGYPPLATQYGEKGFAEYYGEAFCWNDEAPQLSATCMGPKVEGMAEQDDFIYEWEFKKTGGYYYNRVGFPPQKATAYIPKVTPADCISFCFETTGRPVFAVSFKNSFFITREVFGVITTYGPWPGMSAQMWNNGLAYSYLYDAGVEDAVCYYIKKGQTNLYARFLRDNFGVEYTLITGLPAGLNTLFISDFILYRLYLHAVIGHKGIVIKSNLYPPPLFAGGDNLSIAAQFVDGNYTLIIIPAPTKSDSAGIAAEFTDGNYYLAIAIFATQKDSLAFTVGFVNGTYVNDINVLFTTQANKVGIAINLVDGNYTLTTNYVGTYHEKVGITIGFVDGSYFV